MRKLVIAGLVAASLGIAAFPAAAVVVVHVAPPAPLYEVVPPPRHGWVWAPGFWQWRGHRHVWIPGHWVRVRPGDVYAPARWAQRDGYWHYYGPAWSRRADNDGDGVPNAYDRAPNNPYRY